MNSANPDGTVFPLVQGPVKLRRLEEEDLPRRTRWLNEPEVFANVLADFPISLSESREWFRRNLLNRNRWDFVACDSDGSPFGMTGLLNVDLRNRNAQLYITIGEARYRGRGLANHVLTALLRFAFGELGLRKVYLWTTGSNQRARTVYERFGFRAEAVMRRHVFVRGKEEDLHQHSIMAEEFLEIDG